MKTSTKIVLVSGPTGAGKTTLREEFCRALETLAAGEIAIDPEIVPYGGCAVKAPGPTAFSWKDTYLQMLRSLHHPFADSRLMAPPPDAEKAQQILKPLSPEAAQRLSNDRLFRRLQRTIQHRRPKALIFDEAQHLLRVASSQSLVNQLEHIKYIADETQTLHVLFGTYELTSLMDLSSALIRRREVVHFPRYIYDANDPAGSLEGFAKVVAEFARDLQNACDFELLEEVPYLYQGSVGCVGVLRDWLFRAFTKSTGAPGRKITKGILEQTILASSDRLELIKDAKAGEKYFSSRSLCDEEYLKELGFLALEDSSPGATAGEAPKASKPFTRTPHNDQTGLGTLSPDRNKAA
ncbi:MAG: ATP-binding protein [Opitutae bacterium]|nr:ATP-binding protein [Opitutae bacterium]